MLTPFPSDLKVEGSSGSLVPGRENYALEINASGEGRFTRYRPDDFGPPLEQEDFHLSTADLEALWSAIQESEFFSLEPEYTARDVADGAFAELTVTANGRTHRVEARNADVPRFEDLLEVVNRITPPGLDLRYRRGPPD